MITERLKLDESREVSHESRAVTSPDKLEATGDAGRVDPNERHFVTAHLQDDLKRRTVSSGFITVTAQGVQFVLTLSSTMVLARLLSPQDFGLVAIVTTIISFLQVFKEAGLSTATVQREGITHAQVSNLFWINVGLTGSISLLLAALAPAIAWFFREPKLLGITVAIAGTFILSGATLLWRS
jgi:PST family polysaccharide transporter